MLDDALLRNALRKALPRVDRFRSAPRILVVTREPSDAGAIGGWLVGAGYDVAVAATGTEAESLAESFDCAVLDYALADGSGIILAATLSAADRLRSVVFCPNGVATHADDAADTETLERLMEIEANVEAALAEVHETQEAAA